MCHFLFNSSLRVLVFGLIVSCLSFATPLRAEIVNGVTVGSSTSTTAVGFTNGANNVYFIPLTEDFAGTYGVTPVSGGFAGMVSDTGSGWGYNPASGLTMYMRYGFSTGGGPSLASSISFDFVDLDLDGIEDPQDFFESVQFSYYNDAGDTVDLTNTILDANATIISPVTTTLTYGGQNDPLNITFSGATLTNIMNEVTDAGGIYEDEFYVRLQFGSDYTKNATNTSEELMSSSVAANFQQIPEPTSLVLSSVLLGSLSFWRRRRKI